jgi:hypothetical protein
MDEGRVPKMLMTCGIDRRRRKSGPRTKWKAEVEEDLTEMGIIGWTTKAKNRKMKKCNQTSHGFVELYYERSN